MARHFVNKGKLDEVTLESPLPSIDILVLGAHKDDEMFPGGYLVQGIKDHYGVGVVIATDGAGSNYQGVTGQELIDLRTEESRKAVGALRGSFLICYDYPSSHLKSDDGLASFADELTDIIDAVRPQFFLVQSPFEDHYTHIRTTEAGILAARKSKSKPNQIRGYEVWTPLLGVKMVSQNQLDSETAERKAELQAIYESQNSENPYHLATKALTLFNSVMADSHRSAGPGYSELFLDMSPLVQDKRFAGVSAAEYGGGLLILTQVMRTSPLYQVEKKKLSREEMLDWLINTCIPTYRELS